MPDVDRLPKELFPPPSVIRERISHNIIESRYLRRLLRVVEDANEERHRGRLSPRTPTSEMGGAKQ
jgi:hypothetical protein